MKKTKRLPSGQAIVRLSGRDLGYSVHVSETWISNGHWAIKKSRVSNAILLQSQEIAEAFSGKSIGFWRTQTDEQMNKIATNAGSDQFMVTGVSHSVGKGSARLLVSKTAHAWPNDEFLHMFGVRIGDAMYGKDGSTQMRDAEKLEDATLVLMPMRVDEEYTIKHLRHMVATPIKTEAA